MMADDGFTAFATVAAPPLLKSAWLLAGDWHLAQDLVQETLARMFQTWDKSPVMESPQSYAHVVLARLYIDRRRRRGFWERPTDRVADAVAAGEHVELRVAVQAALAQMRPADRAVLVLRYLRDRSVDQVATDLGKSPGAVRAQSKRALERLRAVLGADELQELLNE
jgi:RNA polymerase sigma-70 factor (sigma-E family)